ncbi:MAG TPA: hypothetical protein VGR16_00110 [Thermomicrobiales bacterium]|nr:hypothetical protein [Thermomicrobiales bacterium]
MTDELHAQIKAASQRERRPQAEAIRSVLQPHFDQQERTKVRSIGIAKDSDLQSVDIEDWLAENWRPEEDWDHK